MYFKTGSYIPAVADTNCFHWVWCSQKRSIILWNVLFNKVSLSDSARESSFKNILISGVQYLTKPCKCQMEKMRQNPLCWQS